MLKCSYVGNNKVKYLVIGLSRLQFYITLEYVEEVEYEKEKSVRQRSICQWTSWRVAEYLLRSAPKKMARRRSQ